MLRAAQVGVASPRLLWLQRLRTEAEGPDPAGSALGRQEAVEVPAGLVVLEVEPE